LFILTLRPQIMGRRILWQTDRPIDINDAPFEAFATDDFRRSPVRRVIDSGVALRRRIIDADCPIDFATIRELREDGTTDYLVLPLSFSDGAVHGSSWTTRHPEGFSEAQVAVLDAISTPLARIVEIMTLRRTVLSTSFKCMRRERSRYSLAAVGRRLGLSRILRVTEAAIDLQHPEYRDPSLATSSS
jgi:adenylate cyclase